MKVSALNTTAACNVAAPLRLVDPFTKQVIVDEHGDHLVIHVYGAQSDASRNALRERERKYGKTSEISPEEAERSGGEYLASLIAGWSDNLEDDHGQLAFTRENAIRLMIDQDWIARQVHDFSMNLRNFDPKR